MSADPGRPEIRPEIEDAEPRSGWSAPGGGWPDGGSDTQPGAQPGSPLGSQPGSPFGGPPSQQYGGPADRQYGGGGGWTAAPTRTSPYGRNWRQELLPLIGLLLAGVLLAVVWRLLAPHTAKLGDDDEAAAAVDGTLALLGLVVGALTAGYVLMWPSKTPATRTVTAIVGSMLGAVISWQVGDLIGTPHLRAVGSAFFWPVATSAVLFIGALLPGTSARLQPTDEPPSVPSPVSPPYPPYPA